MELIQSPEVVIPARVDSCEVSLCMWLERRGVRASEVEISTPLAAEVIGDYLATCGSAVQKVHFFESATSADMVLIATHCHNLKALVVGPLSFTLGEDLAMLLLNNLSLEQVWLSEVHFLGEQFQAFICREMQKQVRFLSKMSLLCMTDVTFSDRILGEFSNLFPKLSRFQFRCRGESYYPGDLTAVVMSYPHLQSLCLGGEDVTGEDLVHIAQRCTEIVNLDLSSHTLRLFLNKKCDYL